MIELLISLAAAFPDYDPGREHLVIGDDAQTVATERGDWRLDESGLTLNAPVGWGDNYWLSESDPMREGLVRARFRTSDRPDFAVLFRTTPGAHPEAISGVGLVVQGNQAFFQRWDEGVSLPMHEPTPLAPIGAGRTVEVVVFLNGPQLAGFVYDADTLSELASITVREPTYRSGHVGVLSSAKARDRCEHLSVMLTEPLELDSEAQIGPFGPERLVVLDPEDRARIPSDLASIIAAEEPERLVLVADPVQLEKLRRAGLHPSFVSGHVPFRYLREGFGSYAQGVPRTPDGFRIDGTYKDPAMVRQVIDAYAERFPELTKRVEIGRTHLDQPIMALKISDNPDQNEDEPALLITGATHGSELLSTEYALDVIQHLLEGYGHDDRSSAWVDQAEIWVIPQVNPDGAHVFVDVTRWAGRKNARDTNGNGRLDPWDGVDLNRNYPFRWGTLGERGSRSWDLHYRYRGPQAASEPEVQAVMALADAERFVGAISFHTLATLVLSPYTIDGVDNPVPDVAWPIAQAMVEAAPQQPNGKLYRVRRKIYSVDGVDQDWLYHSHGTLAYIVEGSHHNPEHAATRIASVQGVRPVWQTFIDLMLSSPRLSGHVTDLQGRPLAASVAIEQVNTRADEVWTARARDGRFERILPAEGIYTVVASHPSYATERVTVKVRGSGRPVDIQLGPDKGSNLPE